MNDDSVHRCDVDPREYGDWNPPSIVRSYEGGMLGFMYSRQIQSPMNAVCIGPSLRLDRFGQMIVFPEGWKGLTW